MTLTAEDWGDSDLQIAVEGDRILGMARVRSRGNIAELDKLFIAPDARAAGVGRKLFDGCVQAALSRASRS